MRAYSRDFKLTAVRLSEQPGLQVQAVAAALDIHPFMLSKWRKKARDGVLRGKARLWRHHRGGRFTAFRSWSARTPCSRRSTIS